jgi:O-acetyl-ADP-ribose deacetylase (regulator of RNase III)
MVCKAFHTYFDKLPNVEIINSAFENIGEYDCMVSPANSFGLMDGGIDAAITNYFGSQLMRRVQQYIIAEYLGEQPVGTSFIIATKHEKHPFLAHTPTMRVPMEIAHTDNVYLAMAAMLRAVYIHNRTAERKIETIVCPGLGTGYGNVPFREASRQMALAYHNFLNPPTSINWVFAGQRQSEIRFGGDMGFDFKPEV